MKSRDSAVNDYLMIQKDVGFLYSALIPESQALALPIFQG